MNEEIEPRCEICGRLQGDSPNTFSYEVDWNPETGNHWTCEDLANSPHQHEWHCSICNIDARDLEAMAEEKFGPVILHGDVEMENEEHPEIPLPIDWTIDVMDRGWEAWAHNPDGTIGQVEYGATKEEALQKLKTTMEYWRDNSYE